MDEKEKIEHQLELATRVAGTIKDESTLQRLRNFADQLRQKLHRMRSRNQVRVRAYQLWEEAGRPVAISTSGWRPSAKTKNAWIFEGTHAPKPT